MTLIFNYKKTAALGLPFFMPAIYGLSAIRRFLKKKPTLPDTFQNNCPAEAFRFL